MVSTMKLLTRLLRIHVAYLHQCTGVLRCQHVCMSSTRRACGFCAQRSTWQIMLNNGTCKGVRPPAHHPQMCVHTNQPDENQPHFLFGEGSCSMQSCRKCEPTQNWHILLFTNANLKFSRPYKHSLWTECPTQG